MTPTAKDLLAQLKGVKRNGKGWTALCPAHDDQKASLSISEVGGRLLLNCFAGCSFESLRTALGFDWTERTRRQEIAAYDYRDQDGELRYQSVRFFPKDFRQRRPDANGGWEWNLNGTPRVLYRLPELLKSDSSETVFIVEGEKDANNLAKLGLIATTNAGGALKWRNEYNQSLRDRKVVIICDNDDPGRKHAVQVATSIKGIAASAKIVELPGLPEKGDVSDWLAMGNGVTELRAIVDATPIFEVEIQKAQSVTPASKVCSASELLAREFPEPRWAIPGLLPEGVIIFAGRPKLGKSWLALDIAVAVACGGRALGAIQVEAGEVLYLALEDGPRRLKERLKIILAGGAIPENLFLATEWPRFDDGGLAAFVSWVKQHPEARVVIFDTIKRVRPRENSRSRLYDADYDALGPLGDLARRYGICVLVVHHTRKADSEDPLDLVSGSTGLTGAADGVLVLKRSRGKADATLHAVGRDFEDREIALQWDKVLTGWRMLGDASDFRHSSQRHEVIELLGKSEPLTPKTVCELLGRDRNAIKQLLWKMAKDGDLHADAKGRYSLTKRHPVSTSNSHSRLSEVVHFPAGISDQELERISAEALKKL